MTLMTHVAADYGTGAGDADVSLSGIQVGDLVVYAMFNQESTLPSLTTTINGGAASPTWTLRKNINNGTYYLRVWTATAATAGTWVISGSPHATGNNRRVAGIAKRHPLGIDEVPFNSQDDPDTGTNPLDLSTANCTRACFGLGILYSPSTSTSGTVAWDGGSSVAPRFSGASGNFTSAFDDKMYDVADAGQAISFSNGEQNSHIATLMVWQTNPPPPAKAEDGFTGTKFAATGEIKVGITELGEPGNSSVAFSATGHINNDAYIKHLSGKSGVSFASGGDVLVTHQNSSSVAFAAKGTLSVSPAILHLVGKTSVAFGAKGTINVATPGAIVHLSGKSSAVFAGRGRARIPIIGLPQQVTLLHTINTRYTTQRIIVGRGSNEVSVVEKESHVIRISSTE